MRAGSLDRKITIERVSEGRSSTGAVTETWSTLGTPRAAVKYMSADEPEAAGHASARRKAEFTIRWDTALMPTAKDRISFDGETWDIENVREIQRRRGWILEAVVRDA